MPRKRRFTTVGKEFEMREEKGGKLSTQDDWAGVLLSKVLSVHSIVLSVENFLRSRVKDDCPAGATVVVCSTLDAVHDL
jgi:hypothetical protein